MKWIPVFKTGKHIASNKTEFDTTTDTLEKIIKMNKGREYPLAIGHPKTSSPAWGWANDLKRVGELLYAKPKSLVAEFKSAFDKGMYKNRSLSLNPDLTIRHIGFLGATPPAVEGLPDFEFTAAPDEVVLEFSMSEAYALQDVGSVFQRLREWLIEKFDLDTADRIVSQWQIDNLKTVKPDEDVPAPAAFSKPEGGDTMSKTVEQLEAELAAERAKTAEFSKATEKITTLESDLASERGKNQAMDFSSFLASDEMKKRVSPAMRPAMLDFMGILAGVQTYEFSSPDPADAAKSIKVAKAPLEAFKDFAKAHFPELITTGEVATKGAAVGGEVKSKRDSAEMEFSKAHPGMNYTEVVLALSKEHPELYTER